MLFAGKDLCQWVSAGKDGIVHEPRWKMENGYMEVNRHSGGLITSKSSAMCNCT